MVRDFLWPELEQLEGMDLDKCGFNRMAPRVILPLEQSTYWKGSSVLQSLREMVPWPSRSCDSTPLDFFLWGYLKSLVYANKPQTIEVLKTNIEHEIRAI